MSDVGDGYIPGTRHMAEKQTILRATVGSTMHGLHLEGTDDRDEMGVCIEDLERICGFHEFDQYIFRSASARTGKHDEPSAPGDLDLTIYSLRKFLRLAMLGNPTILTLLFVPGTSCILRDARGGQLQDMAPSIISRDAGKRYLGYMESQRQRLLGEKGQKKVNRPELEAKFGFDTKYAMHLLRLGHQGVELLETGRLHLPIEEPVRTFIRSVRVGEVPLQDVLQKAGDLERRVKDLLDTSPLREHADKEACEKWMVRMYWENWKAQKALERNSEGGYVV